MLRPRVLLAQHFFHPDDVVSARLFTDLGVGLSERGWDVTALASNRSWADPHEKRAEIVDAGGLARHGTGVRRPRDARA